MRKAIIDLGTNTFSILICDVLADSFSVIHKQSIPVKLGQNGIQYAIIAPEAYQRGVQAMIQMQRLLCQFEPIHRVSAIATSAIRSANNGNKFIQEVKRLTGIDVQIIDGLTEAWYIYRGVMLSLSTEIQENFLLMDIGGGSVEFIIANQKEVFWKQSYPIGIARLMGMFEPSDPILETEILEIQDFLMSHLIEVKNKAEVFSVSHLIGVSGSFETYIEMIHALKNTSTSLDQCLYPMTHQDMTLIYQKLIYSTYQERLSMAGLTPIRADMIVVSSILKNLLLSQIQFKHIWASMYSLKEGYIFD